MTDWRRACIRWIQLLTAAGLLVGCPGEDDATVDAGHIGVVDILVTDTAGIPVEDVPAENDVPADADVAEVLDVPDLEPEVLDAGIDGSAEDIAADVPDDVLPVDAPPVPDVVVEEPDCGVVVTVDPPDDLFAPAAGPVQLSASVTGMSSQNYQVQWEIDGFVLGTSLVVGGKTTFSATSLPAGNRQIDARVLTEVGLCPVSSSVNLKLCKSDLTEDFSTALNTALWTTVGDAFWDSNGWIEMTDAVSDRKGQIYNSYEYIESGDVSIRFSVATGGGSNPGADGFAMTILQTDAVSELEAWVSQAEGGGGLGYGIGGGYGSFDGDAFTVEIDTWFNQLNTVEKHTDPTEEDHVSITLDGDPGNPVATFEVPEIEDLVWHDIRVDISANTLVVFFDGEQKIEQNIADLFFRGGYVWFSGSTGYYSNYHRFDDLRILNNCKP